MEHHVKIPQITRAVNMVSIITILSNTITLSNANSLASGFIVRSTNNAAPTEIPRFSKNTAVFTSVLIYPVHFQFFQ